MDINSYMALNSNDCFDEFLYKKTMEKILEELETEKIKLSEDEEMEIIEFLYMKIIIEFSNNLLKKEKCRNIAKEFCEDITIEDIVHDANSDNNKDIVDFMKKDIAMNF